MQGLGVACHGTELTGNFLTVAALSRTGKALVWHAMTQNWQVILSRWLYSVDMQGLGVTCHGKELAGNSLTVAVLSRTGKVGVWHAMTQNWQVILSRWLYSVGQARSGCGMP